MSATKQIAYPAPRLSEIREGNFSSQAQIFLESLSARRSPVKPATVASWRSLISVWILPHIGGEPLSGFDNGAMKRFVDRLCDEKVSPRQVRAIVLVTKLILKSATDENGNFLHPRVWNNSFLDLPPIRSSRAKSATRENIEAAIKSCPTHATFIALAAATGLRIGELLAVRIGNDDTGTCWIEEDSVIHVRQSLWNGQAQDPKTASARRSVDLCAEMNAAVAAFAGNRQGYLFANRAGGPLSPTTIYAALKDTQIPGGVHSLRRFRATRLAEAEVPMPLIKMWLGHAPTREAGITGSYIKPSEMVTRKNWAEKTGLGFLPGSLEVH